MKKNEYSLRVSVFKDGQPRPYADSEYEYEIEAENLNEYAVKRFCKEYLRPCRQTYAQWVEGKENASVYFAGYYVCEQVEENKYRYYVKMPFCD